MGLDRPFHILITGGDSPENTLSRPASNRSNAPRYDRIGCEGRGQTGWGHREQRGNVKGKEILLRVRALVCLHVSEVSTQLVSNMSIISVFWVETKEKEI